MVRIDYFVVPVENTDKHIVVRQVGAERVPLSLSTGGRRHRNPLRFSSRDDAYQAVARQIESDRAACTRLGLTVRQPSPLALEAR